MHDQDKSKSILRLIFIFCWALLIKIIICPFRLLKSISRLLFRILRFVLTLFKQYYNFKTKEKIDIKNRIIEILIYALCTLILGILLFMLGEFGKILFTNNFDDSVIGLFIIFLIYIIMPFFIILLFASQKHSGLSIYVLTIEFLLIALLGNFSVTKKILIITIFTILFLPKIWKKWYKLNIWLLGMVLSAVVLLLIGFYYIDTAYGEKKPTILFNYCENGTNNGINMTCQSNKNGQLILEYLTSCALNRKFIQLEGNTTIYLINGTGIQFEIDHSIEFVPPKDTYRFRFVIMAKDNFNQVFCMDTNPDPRRFIFYSYDELKERKEKLNNYLIALFGIVLFTVPAFTVNLMKIWRKGNQ